MSWEEFLASDLVKTLSLLGNIGTLLILAGMVLRSVFRFIRKSILPWEVWGILLMKIAVWIAVAVYSDTRWLSTAVLWAIIIMLELDSRFYNRLIKRANEQTERAIKQAERAISRIE